MNTVTLTGQLDFLNIKSVPKSYLILISGKMGVGKTLSAKRLEEKFTSKGYLAEVKSFAGAVKQIAVESFGWNCVKDDAGRSLLQGIGNLGRQYNEDIWCERIFEDIENSFYIADIYLIDDWRFPNELSFFDKINMFNILTVRIESDTLGDYKNRDISEISLPLAYLMKEQEYYDFVFWNNGTIEELENKLTTVVETVEKLEE